MADDDQTSRNCGDSFLVLPFCYARASMTGNMRAGKPVERVCVSLSGPAWSKVGMSLRVVAGRLDLSSSSIVCQLDDGETRVVRQVREHGPIPFSTYLGTTPMSKLTGRRLESGVTVWPAPLRPNTVALCPVRTRDQ
jgi:hypothetical protein